MTGQAVPKIWDLTGRWNTGVYCGYTYCEQKASWGVGYSRPVRKFCTHHLITIQWGWLLDDDINYP